MIKLLLILAVSVFSLMADTLPPTLLLPTPAKKAKIQTCSGYTELYNPAHMNIGIKLNIVETDAEWAFREAMKYWAATLDMKYSEDDDLKTCVIELMYAPVENKDFTAKEMETIIAYTHEPSVPDFDGVVYWNNKFSDNDGPLSKQELMSVFIHELGHVFGADHSPDMRSVMYWDSAYSGKLLLIDDLKAISQYHELRRAIYQLRQIESSEK